MVSEFLRNSFEGLYLEDFMNKLNKKLSEKFDVVILNGYIEYANRYRFSNNKLDLDKSMLTDFIDIFVSKGDTYLSQRVSNVSSKEVSDIVSTLDKLFSINLSTEDKYVPPDIKNEYYELIPGVFNDKVFDEDFHLDLLETTLSYEGRNIKRLSGILSVSSEKHFILTSYGVRGEFKTSDFLLRVRGFKDKDFSYTDVKLSVDINEKDVENLVSNIDNMLGAVEYVSTVDEGKYNVLFSPQAFANLLNYLGYMLSGYAYVKNISSLSGLLGEEVASEEIYVYDDPKMEGTPQARSFDDEGIPTRKTEYFIDGVFKDLALNTLTARKLGRESNGHAGIISPHTYPLIFESKSPIENDFDDVAGELGEGIFISNVWYTRFANFRLGNMSTLQRDVGFYISNGKVQGGFIGARLSLTIKDLISKVLFASKADEWVLPWDVWNPSKTGFVALEEVEVTTGF